MIPLGEWVGGMAEAVLNFLVPALLLEREQRIVEYVREALDVGLPRAVHERRHWSAEVLSRRAPRAALAGGQPVPKG